MKRTLSFLNVGFTAALVILQLTTLSITYGIMVVNPVLANVLNIALDVVKGVRQVIIFIKLISEYW